MLESVLKLAYSVLSFLCKELFFNLEKLYLTLTSVSISGVLHQIFECLYDVDVVSEEALLAWETCNDPAELEGKGVAIKSTTQFFVWLKQPSDDEEEGWIDNWIQSAFLDLYQNLKFLSESDVSYTVNKP